MTEDDAKGWLLARFGERAVSALSQFVGLVREESTQQNLISAATLETIWTRHVVDSAQLVTMSDARDGTWLDVGTGAGFPGMVAAILTDRQMILVEPRRRRVEFLTNAAGQLALGRRVTIEQARVEMVLADAAIISARAVASVRTMLANAGHCASRETRWLLPKGRNAAAEVAEAKQSWHGVFHVEQSITDPSSMIVVASEVSRR